MNKIFTTKQHLQLIHFGFFYTFSGNILRVIPILILFLISLCGYSQGKYYDVTKHIPQSGKLIKITGQIQELIDECSKSGGGIIYFPAGEYLTGTLTIKDNTYLELGLGATLFGSMEIEDYYQEDDKSLIYANGAKNCGIIGQGTINGQGDFFWRGKDFPYTRPNCLVIFENCMNVKVSNITLINSPSWNLEVRLCENVWIDGVSILSERKAPNADGIDPVSSKNVFISNCYIDVGDDAICPKTIKGRPLENLVVTNCILISDDAAIKFGTRSDSDMRDMVFSNIVIKNSEYGIAFFGKDGGIIENIRFDNIHIETTTDMAADVTKPMGTYPIFMDLERRGPKAKLGAIRNIYFNDITIDSPDGHCVFFGQPDGKLENINLNNIHYTLHKRGSFEGNTKPRGVRTLTVKADNDFSDVYAHFAFAYMQGLKINNLTIEDLSNEKEFERRMIWGYDIHDVTIRNFSNRLKIPNQKLPQFHFRESSSIEINACSPTTTNSYFLTLEGANKNVLMHNNNFQKVPKLITYDKLFKRAELIMLNNVVKK